MLAFGMVFEVTEWTRLTLQIAPLSGNSSRQFMRELNVNQPELDASLSMP